MRSVNANHWFRPRFRLSALLGCITLICLLLAARSWWAASAGADRAAARRLKELGFNVGYIEDSTRARMEISAGAWFGVDVCRVDSVAIMKPRPPPEETRAEVMALLRSLKSLEVVGLKNFARVNDTDLASLRCLPRLRIVDLQGTDISDDAGETLAVWKDLEIIHVSRTKVGDRFIDHISGLERLSMLIVDDTKVTSTGCTSFRDVHPRAVFSASHLLTTEE